MNKQEFLDNLQEALEFETKLDFGLNLRETGEFDSLSIMSVIAFIHQNFGLKLTAAQLSSLTTVQSLVDICGIVLEA